MNVAPGLPRARLSYEARRQAARRAGHFRLAVLVGAVALIVVLVLVLSSGPSPSKGHGATTTTTSLPPVSTSAPTASSVPAVTSQAAAWKLNSPLASSIVLPGAQSGTVIVAGGSEQGGSRGQGIYEVSTSNGSATQVGVLLSSLDDAASAELNGKGYVFGGNTGTPSATVQLLPNLGTGQASTIAATSAGTMPSARSGAAAVTLGGTMYVVGGSGSTADAAVLATTDGTHFTSVANLPVPVSNAAVTAVGDLIYVFGGDATTGAHAGQPVDAVQVVDPSAHSASLVGTLPEPLAGAAAVTLGGVAYVAGGDATPSSGGSPSAVTTVLAWFPTAKRAVTAGQLSEAVADAGVTVVGSLAYVIGGSGASGTLVSTVQTFGQKAGSSVSAGSS